MHAPELIGWSVRLLVEGPCRIGLRKVDGERNAVAMSEMAKNRTSVVTKGVKRQ